MAEYDFPEGLRYSEEDEWARVDAKGATVGITDYAQQQLGDIVFVELPEVGQSFEKGDPFGVIESVKAVSDLYAPIGGEVVETNAGLVERPESVNEDCYGDGWMIVIRPSDEGDLDALLDASSYAAHVKSRAD